MILEIIAALVLIQISRAGFVIFLHSVYEPLITYSSLILIAIGVILYLLIKPDRKSLGLDFSKIKNANKLIYVLITGIILILIITSVVLFSENNIENIIMELEGVLIFPVFEELLFRGYLWGKLDKDNTKGWQTYLIITLLFGLWHLGYADVIYYRASAHYLDIDMGNIMFNKVLVGIAFGVITGFVKLKTKNTYGCILIHSFLNVFGR